MSSKTVTRCAAIALAGCLALPSAAVSSEAETTDPSSSTLRFLYGYNKRHLLAAADDVPAADYAFRPTAEVRSVAEILGHVADVQYLLCSSARNEPNPSGTGEGSIESSLTDKTALVEALRASFDYCDEVYDELTDAYLARPSRDGGPAAGPLTLNVYHAGQHYGHLTVSMRIKGLIPPSSRPREGATEPQAESGSPG